MKNIFSVALCVASILGCGAYDDADSEDIGTLTQAITAKPGFGWVLNTAGTAPPCVAPASGGSTNCMIPGDIVKNFAGSPSIGFIDIGVDNIGGSSQLPATDMLNAAMVCRDRINSALSSAAVPLRFGEIWSDGLVSSKPLWAVYFKSKRSLSPNLGGNLSGYLYTSVEPGGGTGGPILTESPSVAGTYRSYGRDAHAAFFDLDITDISNYAAQQFVPYTLVLQHVVCAAMLNTLGLGLQSTDTNALTSTAMQPFTKSKTFTTREKCLLKAWAQGNLSQITFGTACP